MAGLTGLSLLAAAASLYRLVVPANWWLPLVLVGAAASILLYVLYYGMFSLLPIALDLVLLCGVLVQHWTVADLRA